METSLLVAITVEREGFCSRLNVRIHVDLNFLAHFRLSAKIKIELLFLNMRRRSVFLSNSGRPLQHLITHAPNTRNETTTAVDAYVDQRRRKNTRSSCTASEILDARQTPSCIANQRAVWWRL